MVEINQSIDNKPVGYDMAAFAFSFFCGILAASIILPGMLIILGSFLLSAAVLFLNRRNRTNLKAAFMLVVFLGGMLDYSLSIGLGSKLGVLDGKTAVYECVITGNAAEKGDYLQYPAKCLTVIHEGKHYNFSEKVFLKISKENSFKFGDQITLKGKCSDMKGKRNPGDFDYRLYYKSKGISKLIIADSASLLRKDSIGIFAKLLYLSKEKVRNTINEALPEEEAAILVGIITGDKADIDEDTRDAYMRTGLSHILSVSGLHVGFLMLMLTYAMMPFKLEKKLQGLIIFLIITYYVLLIGAPLPSVRALLMLAVLLAGKAAGRNYDLLASVSFAGMLMLVIKPLAVYDPGFMISFGAMYSIALLYQPFYGMLRCIPSALRSTVALSLSVWLGLAPVLAYYFNYISVISIIINIIAVPLSMVITIAGFVGVFVGIASKALALYIFSVDYYLISLLTYIIKTASELPIAGFHIPSLPIYIYALYYGGICIGLGYTKSAFFRTYISRITIAYLLTVVIALSFYSLPSRNLKLVFFDVGQGDSCCISIPGKKVVLVDGGGSSQKVDYYYDVGGKITLPALLHQGIWRIDTVIVSHLHDDHMEGLLKVMEVYPVKNLILPKVSAGKDSISKNSGALLELCNRKGIRIYRLGKGDYISLGGGVRMDFLLPGDEAKSDENENSLVGRLTYGGFHALLTGDIGKETEAELPAGVIESSVLKVPHHGSGRSSSEEFLETVKPNISVVSVGTNNFGHPSAEALKRLSDSGSLVFRTDESGAVIVTTDGNSVKVKTVR
ncbi:MAG TPA: DNA internalization-related competence protein ComEC/Rec2 [Clostridia bacterium]|nr:DNA internalization-related competence protein ComEC/Rec2 [Clostridia bacterium]